MKYVGGCNINDKRVSVYSEGATLQYERGRSEQEAAVYTALLLKVMDRCC